MKLVVSVVFVILGSGLSTNEESSEAWSDMSTQLQAMEKVFARSEETHKAAMNTMTNAMTLAKAAELLEKSHLNSSLVAQVTSMVHKHRTSLRKQTQPKGYAALDGAKKMLNKFIFESMSKYDKEILKCVASYRENCQTMEVFQRTISTANKMAANADELVLSSQATIKECDNEIPDTKEKLYEHNEQCFKNLHKLRAELKIVLADIEVMVLILKMTECKKDSSLSQFAMARCTDPCTKKSFIQFRSKGLQEKLNKLQSQLSQNLMSTTFADIFEDVRSFAGAEFLQTASETSADNPNQTSSDPATPRTQKPGSPCKDKAEGAPSAATKRAAKCTIAASPQCPKLQERFLLIQTGIVEKKDRLKADIEKLENDCSETRQELEGKIKHRESMKADASTKLATAMTKKADALSVADETAEMRAQLQEGLEKTMKECSTNYINYETEICALKKIRGELYKMKGGDSSSAFFQDCEVSRWKADSCSQLCGRNSYGEMHLTRTVLTLSNGGAKCLPLSLYQPCNRFPCPVNCKVSSWQQWSQCSAKCGGGVEQRIRKVGQQPKHGGTPCGSISETRPCNGQSCHADCELSSWTRWTACSKDCDGGTSHREKHVDVAARGQGYCPDIHHPARLQEKSCNNEPCKIPNPDQALPCNRSLDVVLLLDGSGSMGEKGFKAEKKAAHYILNSFDTSSNAEGQSKANVAIVIYSGPSTWGGVVRCFHKLGPCKVDLIAHFTRDMKKLNKVIDELKFPKGSTLTSLALGMAASELPLGRKDSKSAVVIITDGKPLFELSTRYAALSIRKKTRLVWIAVSRYAPLKNIKKWATRRWQENIVEVKTRDDLEKAQFMSALMADICPMETRLMDMPWNLS